MAKGSRPDWAKPSRLWTHRLLPSSPEEFKTWGIVMNKRLSRPAILNGVLALATVVIALILSEIFLRIFRPIYLIDNAKAYEYDRELGLRHRSAIHLFRTTDYQEEIKVNQ